MDINDNTPSYKIYKDKFMYGVAYLGGPLAAGYIIAENFKAFGYKEKYKKTWLITIASTIFIFTAVLLIPDSVKIPNYVIPFFYTLIAYSLMRLCQGKEIDAHLNAGGATYSGWRAFLVGLICIAITLAVLIPAAILMVPEEKSEVYLQSYNSIDHELSYNPDHIDKSEVKLLGERLAQVSYLDSTYKMYLHVDKNNTTQLCISFTEAAWNDPGTIAYYQELEDVLKASYQNNTFIEVLMCDTHLNVKKTFK